MGCLGVEVLAQHREGYCRAGFLRLINRRSALGYVSGKIEENLLAATAH
ncbi:hypothetical protein PI125_g3300 [Phytophthora idaei]|nr:hypothetical protein PI125_g3300 [Phytophthora idaei]